MGKEKKRDVGREIQTPGEGGVERWLYGRNWGRGERSHQFYVLVRQMEQRYIRIPLLEIQYCVCVIEPVSVGDS